MVTEENIKDQLEECLAPLRGRQGVLIPALQAVQEKFGYIPEAAIEEIASTADVSPNTAYGVASFYAQFRFERQGEHVIKVCQGTACHVRGGRRILDLVENELGIHPGETTEDYRFSLERVACFGACALAPVMVIDKTVYGQMTAVKARQILAPYLPKPEDSKET